MDNSKIKSVVQFEAPVQALLRFNPQLKASKQDKNAIDIYGEIGENWQGTGITAKMVTEKLAAADGADVVININSAGGDFFEGLAIYNILTQYEGEVTVNVIGMAASAASVIAMAGDTINISEHAFLMIHNSWTIALGNRETMLEVSDMLAGFDKSMAGLYAKKTGIDRKEIAKMMDAETWIDGQAAVEKGFANAMLDDGSVKEDKTETKAHALRQVDTILAKSGVTRSERRALLKQISGTQDAAEELPTPCAGELQDALAKLLAAVKS